MIKLKYEEHPPSFCDESTEVTISDAKRSFNRSICVQNLDLAEVEGWGGWARFNLDSILEVGSKATDLSAYLPKSNPVWGIELDFKTLPKR